MSCSCVRHFLVSYGVFELHVVLCYFTLTVVGNFGQQLWEIIGRVSVLILSGRWLQCGHCFICIILATRTTAGNRHTAGKCICSWFQCSWVMEPVHQVTSTDGPPRVSSCNKAKAPQSEKNIKRVRGITTTMKFKPCRWIQSMSLCGCNIVDMATPSQCILESKLSVTFSPLRDIERERERESAEYLVIVFSLPLIVLPLETAGSNNLKGCSSFFESLLGITKKMGSFKKPF